MKAIIPAAGIGIRLRPLTYSIPKILINVGGKPMISYIIDELINVDELDTIIIVVGHLREKVKDYITKRYSDNRGIAFKFVQQKEMLGLGHAVYQAKDYFRDEPVVIILGDTIFEFDLTKFLLCEHSAIGVKNVDDPSRFGIIETQDGFISKMIEKPSGPEVTESKKAIAGLYYLKNSSKLFGSLDYLIQNDIRTKNEIQLTDALQNMVKNGEKMVTFEIQNWFDCGKPETLLTTNEYLLKKNHSSHIIYNYPESQFIPPVFIGDDCKIENSTIGPYTTLSDGVKIKNSSLKNSIVCEKSQLENSIIEDSIIGSEVNLQGNFKRSCIGDSTELKF